MAWLTGWDRRKEHTINQQAGAGTDYQIPIKVYKGVGVDGTEAYHDVTMGKVYCGGNCRDDFGDIRFTEDDGETELDYWMHDDVSSGVYAVFWIKVSGDLTAGNVKIYIYYDKSDATTTENMTNTFQVAEDNQETAIGAVPVGWVDDSDGICSADVQNDQFKYGDRSTKLNDICNNGYGTTTISGKSLTNYIVMDWYIRMVNCNFYAATLISDSVKAAYIYYDHGSDDFSYLDGSTAYHKIATLADNTWYHIQAYYDWVAQKFVGLYLNGVWKAGNWSMRDAIAETVRQAADQSTGTTGKLWIDCLFIRKYVSNVQGNDPTHGAWGEEEQSGAHYKTVTESLGLVDTKTDVKEIHRSITELLGLDDSIWYVHHPFAASKTITEQLGLLDTKSRVKIAHRTISELLGLVDTKSRIISRYRTITESLRLEDIYYSDKIFCVILNGVAYCHVVNVDFVEVNRVSLPEWINDATPDVDTNIWNLKPLKIIYIFRVTDAEKWSLDQVLTGHTSVKLFDSKYVIIGQDVFMIDLEAVWEGHINYVKPWLITIELIPC